MRALHLYSTTVFLAFFVQVFGAPTGQTAVFAGGCFWCIEASMEKVPGVREAVSGYMGGTADNAHYKKVSSGKTKHREVVQVHYDPNQISYRSLVLAFLKMYDPTDKGGSFYDRGHQYTSAIYVGNHEEEKIAREVISHIEAKKIFKNKIVTPVLKSQTFYPAEEYHQNYYQKEPAHYQQYRQGSGRDRFIEKHWGKVTYSQSAPEGAQPKYAKPSLKELKKRLSSLQYHVTQEEGTEKPFTGAYWNHKKSGIYVDIVSGEPLFSSQHKFESGTGWPSFDRPLVAQNVVSKSDGKYGMSRTEVRSKYGDSHLGHVFDDGPTKTGLRYCINSASLRFVAAEDLISLGYGEFAHLFEPSPLSKGN